MGQRGGGAAFMPDKFVFPGGAVDAEDRALDRRAAARRRDRARGSRSRRRRGLGAGAAAGGGARALGGDRADARAARPGRARRCAVPAAWRGFFAAGLVPNTAALRFVFRAVTPPGRPRRFDARFFLAEARGARRGDDDFAGAGEELAHLQWLDLAAARALPLPFITEVVLAELEALLADPDPARPVPFFHQTPDGPRFRML